MNHYKTRRRFFWAKTIGFSLSLLFFLGSNSTLGQSSQVSLGRELPELVTSEVINTADQPLTISSSKNKIVILDFWATWCSSCISAFPKLIYLQQEFKEKIQIILVNAASTGDTKEKIGHSLNKWQERNGMKLNLPVLVRDTLLDKMFPHNIIPHYVWFDKEGNLLGTTASDEVNATTIKNLMDNKTIPFNSKKDIDTRKPLFIRDDFNAVNIQQYSILVKGWQPGLPSGSKTRITGKVKNGWAITNMPLVTIYNMIFRRLNTEISKKQFILEVNDSTHLTPPSTADARESWMKDNLYTVDFIVPDSRAKNLPRDLLAYMNQHSGFVAQLEKRTIPCWILSRHREGRRLQTSGSNPVNDLENAVAPKLINLPLSKLIERLNDTNNTPFCIDETHFTGNVDLYFSNPLVQPEVILSELGRCGLSLQLAEREIDVVVIKEKN